MYNLSLTQLLVVTTMNNLFIFLHSLFIFSNNPINGEGIFEVLNHKYFY